MGRKRRQTLQSSSDTVNASRISKSLIPIRPASRLRIWSLIGFSVIMMFWELVVRFGGVPPYILPAPSRIAVVFIEQPLLLMRISATTAFEALLGLISATVTGIAVAVFMFRWPRFGSAVYPAMVFSQTIPLIALAPLMVLWFGFGMASRIWAVGLMCFFPILVSTYRAMRDADPDLTRLIRSMGGRPFDEIRFVLSPGAAPSLFAGLKVAATYSVGAAVISEWLGGADGLGVYMIRSQKSFVVEGLFAGILCVAVLTFLVYGIVVFFERRCLPWIKPKDMAHRTRILLRSMQEDALQKGKGTRDSGKNLW